MLGVHNTAQRNPIVRPNYYVDSIGGSDSNNGLTSAAAFQTIGKATSVAGANKRIGLLAGSTFREGVNASGDGQTYMSVGIGAKPIITGFVVATGFSLVANPNLFLNPTLSSGANWTLTSPWTISGGMLVFNGTGSFADAVGATSGLVAGQSYIFTYDLPTVTSLGGFFVLGNMGAGTANVTLDPSQGTGHQVTFTYGHQPADNGVYIRCNGANNFTMDNVSIVSATAGTVYSKGSVTTQPTVATYTVAGVRTLLLPNSSTPTTPGINQFGWSANTLYINVGGDPSSGTVEIGAVSVPFYVAGHQNLSFSNIRFMGSNSTAGMFIWSNTIALSGFTFTGCEFSYNSNHGITAANASSSLKTSNVTCNNCLAEHNGWSGFDFSAGATSVRWLYCEARFNCWGPPGTTNVHGFHGWGGVNAVPTVTNPGGLNCEMGWCLSHDNISDGVNQWSNGGGLHADEWDAGGLIHHNTVYNNGGFGIHCEHHMSGGAGGSTKVYDNVVYGNGTAGLTSALWGVGIQIFRGSQDNEVYQNTVFGNTTNIAAIGDDATTAPYSRNLFRNNIAFGALSGAGGIDLWVSNGADNPGANGSGNFYDYNCYGVLGNLRWTSTNYSTYAAFRTASSQEAHSVASDPSVVSTTTPDFSLQSGSPCMGTGLGSLGILTNFLGQSFTNPPNIGAY